MTRLLALQVLIIVLALTAVTLFVRALDHAQGPQVQEVSR
jgi:hypothetical protein